MMLLLGRESALIRPFKKTTLFELSEMYVAWNRKIKWLLRKFYTFLGY